MIAMIDTIEKRSKILWQTNANEQPIVSIRYRGSIELRQDGNTIVISDEHIEEMVKLIRTTAKIVIE
jgi:hypothetical protein